jgi:hypothetical protein
MHCSFVRIESISRVCAGAAAAGRAPARRGGARRAPKTSSIADRTEPHRTWVPAPHNAHPRLLREKEAPEARGDRFIHRLLSLVRKKISAF